MFRSLRHNFDYQLVGFAFLFVGFFIPVPWIKMVTVVTFSLLMVLRSGYPLALRGIYRSSAFWVFFIFYILHFVGLFYSEDTPDAWRVLILRLPLLLFPLLLFPIPLTREERRSVFLLFAWIVILAGYAGFIKQLFYVAQVDRDSGWFYNDNLVSLFNLQAVYYGMYVSVAFLILLYELISGKEKTGKGLLVFGLISCIALNFLAASRMSMAVLYLGGITLVLVQGKGKVFWKRALVSLFIMGLAIIILVLLFPRTVNRYKILLDGKAEYEFSDPPEYSHFNDVATDEKWNGLNTRLALWDRAIEAVKERPLMGSGTGDLLEDLLVKYREVNFLLGLEREYRTHNQFLEVTVMFGFAGLLAFAWLLVSIFYWEIKNRDAFGVIVLTALVFGMCTEDALSKNQGVIFYVFLMACLASPSIQRSS